MVDAATSWTAEEEAAIREQLNRMLSCELFSQASRQSRFLSYIVEATLTGQTAQLNQFVVGVDVFDRDASFDPVTDSIVRVEAGRLRSKLTEYYAGIGSDDPIVISLPKGGYGIHVEMNAGNATTISTASQPVFKRSNTLLVVLVVLLTIGGVYIGFVKPIISETTKKNAGAADSTTIGYMSGCGREDLDRQAEKPAIAILPFDNMSADPEQEYFSDGITEDIITDLSIISGLTVISRHSTFVYKDQSISIRKIGENLCARYILEGSVRKEGNQLRITAQLIDALTDAHVWANRYDRYFDDVFAIQGEVSRMIVNALEVELTDMEQSRLGHVGTGNSAAYDLYIRGRERFYLFTQEGIGQSLDLFSQAIALDPLYAEAYAWKSRVLVYTFITGINNSNAETVGPAIEFARKAIELDELLPIAHANLGWALQWNRETEAAISAVGLAIELDSNFANAYLWLSMIMSSAGRGQEALDSIEKGLRVNPNYGVTYVLALGRAYFTVGEGDKALTQFDRGIARNPNFLPNHVYRIFALESLGRLEEAANAGDELSQIFPSYEFSAAYLFYFDER